jgi:hypothetical protein
MSAIAATDVVGAWPPRKLLTVTGLSGATFVTVNRIVGGARTPVRDLNFIFVGTTTTVVVDAELPFGLPVTYELIDNDVVTDTDGPYTTTLTGGKVALTDAITALAAEVVIFAHDDLAHDAEATVFQVDGANYVVSDKIGQPTATWEFYTETTTAHDDLMTLLRECTTGVFQQRQPGGYDGVDGYYAPLSVAVRRFSQDGSDERRITAVRMAETAGWHEGMLTRGYTLQDVADAYTGQTLADLAGDYATLLLLAQGDFS